MKREVLFGGIAVVLILAFLFWLEESKPGEYDGFAQCLTEQGARMYGSYQCGHCNEQKEMFGKSWKYVGYVECSNPGGMGQKQECYDADIRAYPTWEFGDKSRELGLMSFGELSNRTGCVLPA